MFRTSIRGRYPQKPLKKPISGRNVLGMVEAKLLLQSICNKLDKSLNQEALVSFNADRQNADIAFVIGTREMRISFTEGGQSC